MAVVKSVSPGSPFAKDILPGDLLVSVNGHEIHDLLDYMYYSVSERVNITVERNGRRLSFTHTTDFADPGVEYDTYLMDKQRHCANKCIFCFIDQLPKNMRPTMYFKDDDFRLSLLYGNYVTLTNATDADIQRIIDLRVSPLNISVHTTDPELRVRMLANPRAGKILTILRQFEDAGIDMRCQIVLCKGFNDGQALQKTMSDLKDLYPAVSSVSVVPFGCSDYRQGLCHIDPFTAEECAAVLEQINTFGDGCVRDLGTRLIYPADEFYIKAGIHVPEEAFYEEFEQIENGVGMLSSFISEFLQRLDQIAPDPSPKSVSVISGMTMQATLPLLMDKLRDKLTGLDFRLHFIKNNFFGSNITVTGLITATDIIDQLKKVPHADTLVLPSVMLRDDKFLDDISVSDVEKALGVEIKVIGCSGFETVDAFAQIVKE